MLLTVYIIPNNLALVKSNLYAKRQLKQGISFKPEEIWQQNLSDSFAHQETPDQETVINQIIADRCMYADDGKPVLFRRVIFIEGCDLFIKPYRIFRSKTFPFYREHFIDLHAVLPEGG